ncbi:hypothetical protein L207DRAFT_560909 [Hyaloscypha variabilis F]|uniref:Uncharacterized protein n=1 Tax=Hyaloscypha variabilis (strain UAMH 11265 / GT02V1 / F) TaxID=1149755 RepID=A0A2J6S9F7_HYAVF|nr:hypothetical protein L207DRAFT_560909 [Hyaloscypha variabilis F]
MIDQNASRSCLEGCLVHNSEATTQSDNLDREILSYFLVRRNFGTQASETASTSDRNSNAPNDATPVTSHRKHLIRHHSSERSPRSPNTAKSGESRKIKGRKGDSKGSSRSASSRYPNITNWSAGIRTTSPSSFGPPQRNPADPPRPPKSGHEWVWFPEGYWAEREIRGFMPPNHDSKQKWWDRSSAQGSHKSLASQRSQKSQSPRKLANEDTNTDDNKPPLSFIPQIKIGSISLKSTRKTSRQTSQHASDESRKNSSFWRLNFHKPLRTNVRQSSQEREGLYRWTKRTLETQLRKRSADKLSIKLLERPGNLASHTTMLLQGASTYFDRAHHRSNHLATLSPSTSSLDGRRRPKLGIAPWHRRHSNDSLMSVTSSVRNLLMGKTPVATPIPEKHYVGPDGMTYPTGKMKNQNAKYCQADIWILVQLASHDPDEPTFLPSEARRINTPPLYPDTPDGQAPDLPFDISATGDDSSPVHSDHTQKSGGTPKTSPPRSRQLWEAGTMNANTGNKSTHPLGRGPPADLMSPTMFELNLPEHLPSSPLCPKNPKHDSGGTGICVYHGRRRSGGLKHLKRASTATEESVGPSKEL